MRRLPSSIIALILLVAVVGACDFAPERFLTGWYKPVPALLGSPDENASWKYKLGWKHGCESGLAAYGNDYYKAFYSFQSDEKLVSDPEYYKPWVDAFHYCRSYVNRYLISGFLWGEGWNATESTSKFGDYGPLFETGDLRGPRQVNMEGAKWPNFMQGLDTPGWGETSWGGSVDNSTDWLGAPKRDWLGRLPEDQ